MKEPTEYACELVDKMFCGVLPDQQYDAVCVHALMAVYFPEIEDARLHAALAAELAKAMELLRQQTNVTWTN